MRIPTIQPPIHPFARDREQHDFWPGLVLAIMGVIIWFCGVQHLTNLETLEGVGAWEHQLIKAFSNGGLEYVDTRGFPNPATLTDPAAAAAAFERLERASGREISFKLRVNTGAVDPCPT